MGRRGLSPRIQLVRKLADIVVLPADQISSNERSLVADILLEVVGKVEAPLRIEVAQRIARVPECPPALVRMLVLDEPDVAKEIILEAEHVPEALLIEAAREGATAHRLFISQRHGLSSSVADAALQFNEIEVCKNILKREDCSLSAHALNRLVALCATATDLQPLLLRRAELEPAHGFMMFWWVDAERRKRILNRFSLDRRLLQDALQNLYPLVFQVDDPDNVVKDILVLADRRHRARGPNGSPVTMDIVVQTLIAAHKIPSKEMIEATAMIANISQDLASRILRDPEGEPFAVLCKSLGVPRRSFLEIARSESELLDNSDEHTEYLLGVFDSMARDFSRAIIRYWDWDGNPRIAFIKQQLGLNQ